VLPLLSPGRPTNLLSGLTWSARRGIYRVLYEIDDDNRIVLVAAVEHRSDAYRSR